MSEPCAFCGALPVWVRDDDVPHCQACRDEDDTGLAWWPVRRSRPRPDFDPRVDYPERYGEGPLLTY